MKFSPFATELKNLQTGNKSLKEAFDAFSTNYILEPEKNAENLRQVLAWCDWMKHHAETIIRIAENQKKQAQEIAEGRTDRPRKNFDTKYDLLKQQYPDAVYMFRCGDFYEAYKEDAVKIANALDITLSDCKVIGCKMCGFPFHCLDQYLPKLVRAGYRIAICDNIREDANLHYITVEEVKRELYHATATA